MLMHILVSNDDGYLAPGIKALAGALAALGKITVVAPDRDRSGASNSLTLTRPLRAKLADNGFTYVDGTPTDCVHLALFGLLDTPPDLVVSGINAGANLGDDVIYSGTVAAAMEGRFLGLPSLALSLVSDKPANYAIAAEVALVLTRSLGRLELPAATLLNVNGPDLGNARPKGFKLTRLGQRHKAEAVVRELDPRGREIFWIGAAGPELDAGPGTDFHAIREGYVSITPIHADLTDKRDAPELDRWLQTL